MSGKKLSYSDESCFTADTAVRRVVRKIISYRPLKIQKHSVRIVSTFYFLCLYKTGNFDIVIKKSSFIFLRYDLLDSPLVYCCSFSSNTVNKMIDFCCEKVYVR